ncbi:iron-siderophore ABC transporter substrate-binding protein [Rhodococcus sp. BP-252]|uniref:Iron-siderophore ABC transporter substrate-binding protein n=1 Tax=Rhodococcoides kyotonense TaxID=398843 RepID=A0A177YHF6_9NOCA|nr:MULTISPECIES: iron-siderophore ABC transporter substrate-binding protein [Rhodococcus]NIL76756.1 putative siderophore-binding lipoprotein YfiY [Rhodococcus sp. B10]MBY6412704.1 iron-siderophore ABC transporter substrate-binding protein [Rhodococcus sp. BP-320]MBY6417498.1 iron-siderophore ABC transporter substrate-binding protein [Rhodococcus sp. BP-321]MBY6421724.1 iron-siderophore ABC transporter substrate-binding protein [Rhodococcus sp. BP-324]MBY6427463.1 iron-siderophore ABC transport
MKRAPLLLALAATVTLVAACGSTEPAATSSSAPTTTIAPGPTGVPDGMGSPGVDDGVFPRTVGHFGGSTEIPSEPKRIVVIATGQLDSVLTLGVVPTGVAYGDGAALVPDYLAREFPQYASQMADFVDVGHRQSPDLEAIAALQPDLILANEAGSEENYETLSAIAPTVLTEGTGVNWKQDFLLLADALGRTQQAQSFLDEFTTRAHDFGNSVQGSPTVSFVRFTADRARVFGVASFVGYIAWDANLARPESQQFDKTSQDFSEEEIQSADADRVFVGSQTSDAGSRADQYTTNPLWTGMSASTEGHIVSVEDDPWYLNAGPTAATLVLDGLEESLR